MAARAMPPSGNMSQALLRLAEIGEHSPMYATAAGKVILAHRSDSEVDQYLHSVKLVPITKNTITDPKKLLNEIKKIRAGEIAYNSGELNEGTIAASAPVFDLYGRILAALTVITPSFRFDDKKRNTLNVRYARRQQLSQNNSGLVRTDNDA